MTTRNQAYDTLSVYGTDGEEYYPGPVDGTGRPEVRNWFLSTGLRCYLDTEQPELMVYLGDVRHPQERDQAFAVYDGGDRNTLFEDFQQAVRHQLVEEHGWEVIEETTPSDQKALFHFLVGRHSATREPEPRPLTQYTAYTSELFQRSLQASNTTHTVEPIEVIARDYHIAAELVHTYSDISPIRIHVYDNQEIQPPEEADLVIKVEPGPYEVKVPPVTEELLRSLQHRLKSHKAQERKQVTIDALASHADHEDSPEIVRDAVEKGFQNHYDSFEVIESQRREQLENQLEKKQRELEQTTAELETSQAELKNERRKRKRAERKAKVKEYTSDPSYFPVLVLLLFLLIGGILGALWYISTGNFLL